MTKRKNKRKSNKENRIYEKINSKYSRKVIQELHTRISIVCRRSPEVQTDHMEGHALKAKNDRLIHLVESNPLIESMSLNPEDKNALLTASPSKNSQVNFKESQTFNGRKLIRL